MSECGYLCLEKDLGLYISYAIPFTSDRLHDDERQNRIKQNRTKPDRTKTR